MEESLENKTIITISDSKKQKFSQKMPAIVYISLTVLFMALSIPPFFFIQSDVKNILKSEGSFASSSFEIQKPGILNHEANKFLVENYKKLCHIFSCLETGYFVKASEEITALINDPSLPENIKIYALPESLKEYLLTIQQFIKWETAQEKNSKLLKELIGTSHIPGMNQARKEKDFYYKTAESLLLNTDTIVNYVKTVPNQVVIDGFKMAEVMPFYIVNNYLQSEKNFTYSICALYEREIYYNYASAKGASLQVLKLVNQYLATDFGKPRIASCEPIWKEIEFLKAQDPEHFGEHSSTPALSKYTDYFYKFVKAKANGLRKTERLNTHIPGLK